MSKNTESSVTAYILVSLRDDGAHYVSSVEYDEGCWGEVDDFCKAKLFDADSVHAARRFVNASTVSGSDYRFGVREVTVTPGPFIYVPA